MSFFASAAIWRGMVRFVLFWAVVAAVLVALAGFTPFSDWSLVYYVLKEVSDGSIVRVAEKSFAFALSSGIVQLAVALAIAFLVCHVLFLRAALSAARRALGPDNVQSFAADFDTISEQLGRNAVVGPAWREFEKTAVREDDAVHATIRPQAFLNLRDVRERLFGLKMMGSIPGFFVGLGLLLTFIGLVLALNNAAQSTSAASAQDMTESLSGLLKAATFKFSTSIAGLGASLVLSLLFRTYQIWIDSGFYRFCSALENRMLVHPIQQIAAESRDILAAQRDELKEINSDRFFARLGESVTPALQAAMTNAIRPVSEQLDQTMEALTQTSRTGVDDLVHKFSETLSQGAGRELTTVVDTLKGLKEALDRTQSSLAGSGQDFASKLAEAAAAMSRMIGEAGRALAGSTEGVAGAIEAALARVTEKLEEQTTGLAAQMKESARSSQEAGEAAAGATRRAAEEAASASTAAAREALETVRAGMGEVVASVRDDISHLSEALRFVADAFAAQIPQIETVSARSRDTADAFGRVATDVRSASQPLLAHSERVASSSDRMAVSIESAVGALSTTQEKAGAIADRLSAHLDQIGRVWDQYEARFKSVDEDFGKVADRFHEEVSRHQEAMRDFVKSIDDHTGSILGKISTAMSGLGESIEALDETLDGLRRTMAPRQAAE